MQNAEPPLPADPAEPVADGVSYHVVEGVSGRFFRCAPYQATIRVRACAERFERAQGATGEALDGVIRCQKCPIGAAHAGRDVTYFSPLYDSNICPRCHKFSTRILMDRVCVSCRNRELELEKGVNSKGTRPVKAMSLARRRVRYAVIGRAGVTQVRTATLERAIDTTEVVTAVLRKTPGRVMFFWAGSSPLLSEASTQ